MPELLRVRLADVYRDTAEWPRSRLVTDRVEQFVDLYGDGWVDALPPLEVVRAADGRLWLADGWHRWEALHELEAFGIDFESEVPVVVIDPAGRIPGDVCFERGIATCLTASLPLTQAEKRCAVERLIGRNPSLSNRQIAKQVGVSPTTVGTVRRNMSNLDIQSAAVALPVMRSESEVDKVAVRLSSYLLQLHDARDLFDMLSPTRMGHHLAVTFDRRLGDGALSFARRAETWLHATVVQLERES
jgi:hypothetical protein